MEENCLFLGTSQELSMMLLTNHSPETSSGTPLLVLIQVFVRSLLNPQEFVPEIISTHVLEEYAWEHCWVSSTIPHLSGGWAQEPFEGLRILVFSVNTAGIWQGCWELPSSCSPLPASCLAQSGLELGKQPLFWSPVNLLWREINTVYTKQSAEKPQLWKQLWD